MSNVGRATGMDCVLTGQTLCLHVSLAIAVTTRENYLAGFWRLTRHGTRGGFSCQQREVRKGSFLLTAEQKQQKKKELDI